MGGSGGGLSFSSGGRSSGSNDDAQAAEMQHRVMQAFATPATQGMIAQQLAQGGYGTDPSIFEQLGQTHQSVNVPILQTPEDYAALKKLAEKDK